MAGLLDFISSPGAMDLAQGLLAAGKPSRIPVGNLQALGQGLQAYQAGQLAREATALKKQKAESLMALQKAQAGKYEADAAKIVANPDGKTPMNVLEYKYYINLKTDAEREEYLRVKRANRPIDIGPSLVTPSQANPAQPPIATITKGLDPKDEPKHIKNITEIKQTAQDTSTANTEQFKLANDSVGQVYKINTLLDQLHSSEAVTGMGARIFNGINRAKALFGSDAAAGKVKDTELLGIMMGSEVFPMIKTLDIGSKGMDTPAERDFMLEVLTGKITLSKGTLIKMAETRKNIASRIIDKWNDRVEAGELDKWFKSSDRRNKKLSYGKATKLEGSIKPKAQSILDRYKLGAK